mmetsp:Transcript_6179/g.17253  ORF Transcript_6179/g.17253 Transcript_6179/m.17253 type:complete len:1117 (-) Transcript_6179:483-3833(-)|eukprot:CAMPEP_0117696834 /NCGR_PEP_ID=MMETSP0804-20121206/28886_1 /TAXON_ID=1074897 /ORGANISM="Tetraselmis astigmatica, Strain CCMP880" /LENGTH=1116 /DNA_ID=CAMNT_0005511003 /DNA_START=303 /DNA_END=3653 /DNA_ORIENTATION=-
MKAKEILSKIKAKKRTPKPKARPALEVDGQQLLESLQAQQTKPKPIWREIDLSEVAPSCLLGRLVAVYWGAEDAFFWARVAVGPAGISPALHHLKYSDGEEDSVLLAAERTRLEMYPGEVLPFATVPELACTATELEAKIEDWKRAARRSKASKGKPFHEAFEAAADGRSLSMLEERLKQLQQRISEEKGKPLAGDWTAEQLLPHKENGDTETPAAVFRRVEVNEGVNIWLHCPPLSARTGEEAEDVQEGSVEGEGERKEEETMPLLQLMGGVGAAGRFVQGEVAWAKLPSFPWWPVMVTTFDDAVYEGRCRNMAPSCKTMVAIRCFGPGHEHVRVPASKLMTLEEGVRQGLHRGVKLKLLQRALQQLVEYGKTGELPEEMLVFNEECEDIGQSHPAASKGSKKSCKFNWAEMPDPSTVSFPLKLSPVLTVESLGEVEYINPNYHCKDAFFPVGFRAVKMMYPGKVPHLLEVLRRPGFGGGEAPLFQITQGTGQEKKTVQGPSPREAWEQLFSTGEAPPRANMLVAFGLVSPAVIACLQAQPGAPHCSRYCWRGGEKPVADPLSPEEEDMQLAIVSSLLKLRRNAKPVHLERLSEQSSCHACGMIEEFDEDFMMQCDKCRMSVHMSCYGVKEYSNGKLWLCDVCRVPGLNTMPPCMLCPTAGGAMKRTDNNEWCHLACARWVPEVGLNPEAPIAVTMTSKIHPARYEMTCILCRQRHGACIQCNADNKCRRAFHVLCAANAGYYLALREVVGRDPGASRGGVGAPGLDGSMPDGGEESSQLELVHYCAHHTKNPPKEARKGGTELVGWRSPGGGSPSKRPKGISSLAQNPGRVSGDDTAPNPGTYVPPESSGGSARTTPFNPWLRRGLREPDVVEALGSKRLYVSQLPFVVTGRTGPSIQPPAAPSHCHRQHVLQVTAGGPDRQIPLLEATNPKVLSTKERLSALGHEVERGIAAGKSAIHGWGAFAKLPYRQGDMVVEYIGELVHPSVANLRETKLYNSMVGAGTYIFKLSEQQCVDATCAGNIAHLLNHSCEPNCYSRVITVGGENHVVIFAKRNIRPGEELTYDYRFGSTEKLPCNCCADRCRGYVNIYDPDNALSLFPRTVQRDELLPWNPS